MPHEQLAFFYMFLKGRYRYPRAAPYGVWCMTRGQGMCPSIGRICKVSLSCWVDEQSVYQLTTTASLIGDDVLQTNVVCLKLAWLDKGFVTLSADVLSGYRVSDSNKLERRGSITLYHNVYTHDGQDQTKF